MRAGRVAALLVPALATALLLPACDGGDPAAPGPAAPGPAEPDSPLATCAELVEPPAGAAASAPAGSGGDGLPALTLPCFTGGDPFALADLRGPAVVNLWASWCLPCREELPALQRYADRAAGEVHVLGVVVEDRPAAAASLAQDLGIRFPAIEDREGELPAGVGTGQVLPATLFVDAAGDLAYLHRGPLDEETLAGHVAEYLGVPAGAGG